MNIELSSGRARNLFVAIVIPAVLFIAITFIVLLAGEWRPDITSVAAARVNVAFDRFGVMTFVAVLAAGLVFLWRALGRWAFLAAVVYVPAMFVMVLYIGLFIAGMFFGRTS